MRVDDDPALRRLPEHLGQPDHRHRRTGDDVGQHLAWPDRRQLIDVADQDQGCPGWHRLEQAVQQRHVDHRDLVHDQQLAIQLVLLIALEAAARRVGLEQTMQGLGLEAGGLAHPLGGPAGGCGKGDALRSGPQDLEDGVDQRGLADAGAAGDHQDLGAQCQPHRFPLAGSQDQAGSLLDPRDGPVGIDRGPGLASAAQPEQPLGDALLGAVEPGQEQAGAALGRVADDGTIGQLQRDRCIHHRDGDLQQRGGALAQLVRRQAAMALVHGFGQSVADPGPGADHRRLLDPEPHRDLIGTLEADAPDVAGQAVGVLRDDLDGIGTVGLEDPHRA